MNKQLGKSSLLYHEGRKLILSKDFEAAIERLKKSSELIPHFKTLELLGECFLEQKNYSQAIIYLAAAAGLGNKSFRSYFLLAKALLEFDEVDKATEKLNEALRLNPNYREAKNLLSDIS